MSALTIPTGGTTGHCHESTSQIDEAARWLASLSPVDREALSPIVPALKARYGLTAQEACAAIRDAGQYRERACG